MNAEGKNVLRVSIVSVKVLLEKQQILVYHYSSRGAKQDRIKIHCLLKPLKCSLLLHLFCCSSPSVSQHQNSQKMPGSVPFPCPFCPPTLLFPPLSLLLCFQLISDLQNWALLPCNPAQFSLQCSFSSLPFTINSPFLFLSVLCFGPQAQQPVCQVCHRLLRSFCFQIELVAEYHSEYCCSNCLHQKEEQKSCRWGPDLKTDCCCKALSQQAFVTTILNQYFVEYLL